MRRFCSVARGRRRVHAAAEAQGARRVARVGAAADVPKRDAHGVFFYSQVDVTPEEAAPTRRQALLHGLLGQRAAPPADGGRGIRAGNRATLRRVVNALGDTEDAGGRR